MSNFYIGTSGFNYKHWKEIFYPRELPQSKWLEYYSRFFNSVEINVSFYRLPSEKTFETWAAITPKDFGFAVKGSRYITQYKKLIDVDESLEAFFCVASHLLKKLKVVLWQFPPNFQKDLDRLEHFCEKLKSNPTARLVDHAFEFRHISWFNDDVYALLKRYNYALCIADSSRWPTPLVTTADYTYLRYHGGQELSTSEYSHKELEAFAKEMAEIKIHEKTIYAYFNNDTSGFAISNAEELKEKISRDGYSQKSGGNNGEFSLF